MVLSWKGSVDSSTAGSNPVTSADLTCGCSRTGQGTVLEFDTWFLIRYTRVMNVCSKCQISKPEDEFSWKKKGVKRASVCKACQRELARSHYNANKQYYKDKSKKNRKNYRDRGKVYLVEYLMNHPCVDCGNDDIEVLQFDHVQELNNCKAPRVTSLVNESLARIKKEIDKCEVRCANCHVRKTRRASGTLRLSGSTPAARGTSLRN